jgi:hypothetical protein
MSREAGAHSTIGLLILENARIQSFAQSVIAIMGAPGVGGLRQGRRIYVRKEGASPVWRMLISPPTESIIPDSCSLFPEIGVESSTP